MSNREHDIGRLFHSIRPPADVEERAARLARRAVAETAKRRPLRSPRTVVALALLIALCAGGAALGLVITSRGESGISVPPGPERGRAGRAESPILGGLPWLYQAKGSKRIDAVKRAPSLSFPPGTSYGKAVRALFDSVVTRGEIPKGARVTAPLPQGVVFRTTGRRARPRLDLTAAFGYAVPSGRILTPTLSAKPSVSRSALRRVLRALSSGRLAPTRLPKGISVDVPRLKGCQVWTKGRRPPTCTLSPPSAPASAAQVGS